MDNTIKSQGEQRWIFMQNFSKIHKEEEKLKKYREEIKEKSAHLKYLENKCEKIRSLNRVKKKISELQKKVTQDDIKNVLKVEKVGIAMGKLFLSFFELKKNIDDNATIDFWNKNIDTILNKIQKFDALTMIITPKLGFREKRFKEIFKNGINDFKKNNAVLFLFEVVNITQLLGLDSNDEIFMSPIPEGELGLNKLFQEEEEEESDFGGGLFD